MKKYLAFTKYSFKEQFSFKLSYFAPILSYIIHILILEQLFSFVFADKITDGFSRNNLIWYVIFAEIFMYSFYNSFKSIAEDIKNGNIAYNMSKPYNFMLRIIAEQFAISFKTFALLIVGLLLGLYLAGPIELTIIQVLLLIPIIVLALLLELLLHLIVGILSLWIGQDVTSIWWIISKFMLILVFTPLDFFPSILQTIFKIIPTTHITYTPCQLIVHFSYTNYFNSLLLIVYSICALTTICIILYKKGVKKLNVNGI